MRLEQAIRLLKNLPEEFVICAVKPWTRQSWCILTGVDGEHRLPKEIKDTRYEYFLEVSVARDVMVGANGREMPADKLPELLIHYAQFDGFPDWANQLFAE